MNYIHALFPNTLNGLEKDIYDLPRRLGEGKAGEWIRNDLLTSSQKITQNFRRKGTDALETYAPFLIRRPYVSLALGIGALALTQLFFSQKRTSLRTSFEETKQPFQGELH